MKRSLRVPAALLALAALSAGLAEGAAAQCVPAGDAEGAKALHHAGAHAPPTADHVHDADPAPGTGPDRPGHPSPARGDGPACPTGMTGAGGACGLVLLAGAVPVPVVADAAPSLTVPALAAADGRLDPSGHFRPPRV